MNITFPDGSVKQYEDGMTALQIAESISPRLRKATLAAEIDGSRADAFRPFQATTALSSSPGKMKTAAGPCAIQPPIYLPRP